MSPFEVSITLKNQTCRQAPTLKNTNKHTRARTHTHTHRGSPYSSIFVVLCGSPITYQLHIFLSSHSSSSPTFLPASTCLLSEPAAAILSSVFPPSFYVHNLFQNTIQQGMHTRTRTCTHKHTLHVNTYQHVKGSVS